MTYQWTPPQQQPPMQPPGGGGGGGNGLVYALIGLVAVLVVVVGAVALALGVGRAEDSGLVATPAPPAPAADDGRPDPTGDAASDADAGAGARPIDVGQGSAEWASQCRTSGTNPYYPICNDCFDGPGYAAQTGSPSTSCPFASMVSKELHLAIASTYPRPGTVTVQANSPVTGQTYTMTCVLENRSGTDATYHCTGGNNAVVFVGIAG